MNIGLLIFVFWLHFEFLSYLNYRLFGHEYRATKGILRPKPNAFELTLKIGGA